MRQIADHFDGMEVAERVQECFSFARWLNRFGVKMASETEKAQRTAVYILAEYLAATDLQVLSKDFESELGRSTQISWRLRQHFGLGSVATWEPDGESITEERVSSWLEAVARRYAFWPSQMAAIRALAVQGASPYEARQAARRAFGVAQ